MSIQFGDRSRRRALGARRLPFQMRLVLDLSKAKRDRARIAKLCQVIDPGPSRIAQAQQFGDFVKASPAASSSVRPTSE
jgi:hypothetical protein